MPLILNGTTGVNAAGLVLTNPLTMANGGTGVTSVKSMVQNLNFTTGAVATGTTILPLDDTIPQQTEGDQYMSLAITPTNALSVLEVSVVLYGSASLAAWLISALFRDTVANSVAVGAVYQGTAGGGIVHTYSYTVVAGSTLSTTFKVRAGAQIAATFYFNSNSTTRIFGGTLASSITIKEYLP